MLTSSTLNIPQKKTTSKRIEVIDALRGFALLGIILTHSTAVFKETTSYSASYSDSGILSMLDSFINTSVHFLAKGKFYTIFSFLFGLSFAIQLQNARSKGKPFSRRFIWRLAILFIIGCLHNLLYSGDILQIYAVLGLVLIVCADLKNKELVLLSTLFYVVSIAAILSSSELSEDVNQLMVTVSNSELLSFLGLRKLDFQILTGRLFVTISLFVLGLYVGRKNIFTYTLENRLLFKKILIGSNIAALVSMVIYGLAKSSETIPSSYLNAISAVEGIALSSFYVAIIVHLYRVEVFHRVLQRLVPVGKMGLSIYIMQSLFLTQFYNLGSDIIARIGLTTVIGFTVFFFLIQILFASWWMSRYRFGPVEWLWRTLIVFKWQPIVDNRLR